MLKKIFIVLVVIFVIIQFFRPARNNGAMASATDITHFVAVTRYSDAYPPKILFTIAIPTTQIIPGTPISIR